MQVGGGMNGWLIRAQQARSKRISCIGQPLTFDPALFSQDANFRASHARCDALWASCAASLGAGVLIYIYIY